MKLCKILVQNAVAQTQLYKLLMNKNLKINTMVFFGGFVSVGGGFLLNGCF